MKDDSQARKYQLTVNNPADKEGYTHEDIRVTISNGLKSTVYYCMADEIGENGTPHTHLYIAFSSPVRFSTLKNLFPAAHIEKALGTSEKNRDYILKAGKWAGSEKGHTSIEGTFEEVGVMPQDGKGGKATSLDELYNMIKAGASDFEIFERNPGNIRFVGQIEKVRQAISREETRRTFRPVMTYYIYGASGAGKTRFVMENHGYDQVYRVTDYAHPFDNYNGEPVICFDEFKDSLPIRDMLKYLDGYPVELPARYANKWAAYTTAYLLSNTPLDGQYLTSQLDEKEVWDAFLRRLGGGVIEFLPDGTQMKYSVEDYFTQQTTPTASFGR